MLPNLQSFFPDHTNSLNHQELTSTGQCKSIQNTERKTNSSHIVTRLFHSISFHLSNELIKPQLMSPHPKLHLRKNLNWEIEEEENKNPNPTKTNSERKNETGNMKKAFQKCLIDHSCTTHAGAKERSPRLALFFTFWWSRCDFLR